MCGNQRMFWDGTETYGILSFPIDRDRVFDSRNQNSMVSAGQPTPGIVGEHLRRDIHGTNAAQRIPTALCWPRFPPSIVSGTTITNTSHVCTQR